MIGLEIVLLGIVVGFFVVLFIKEKTKRSFCVLCMTVLIAWIISLCLSLLTDLTVDLVLLAILMGGTASGSIYVIERKLDSKYHLFKLPTYLTLVTIFYYILKPVGIALLILEVLIGLWIIYLFIYKYRNDKKIKSLADKIIACCRDW